MKVICFQTLILFSRPFLTKLIKSVTIYYQNFRLSLEWPFFYWHLMNN